MKKMKTLLAISLAALALAVPAAARAGQISLVSQAPVPSRSATAGGKSAAWQISMDGRYVAYLSRAADLVTGLTGPAYLPDNAYVWDRTTGANLLLSRSALFPGRYADGDSLTPILAANGSGLMFSSAASDLLAGDYTLDPYGRSFQDVFFYTLP